VSTLLDDLRADDGTQHAVMPPSGLVCLGVRVVRL
jgi:hypothetical protein